MYVFSFWELCPWGLCPQTPIRVLPLDPAGGLLSLVPRYCPPPKQISGYAPDSNNAQRLLPYVIERYKLERKVYKRLSQPPMVDNKKKLLTVKNHVSCCSAER